MMVHLARESQESSLSLKVCLLYEAENEGESQKKGEQRGPRRGRDAGLGARTADSGGTHLRSHPLFWTLPLLSY